MNKDMKYYVEISNRIMLKNLHDKNYLIGKAFQVFMKAKADKIGIIASGSSLNAALSAENAFRKYSGCEITIMSPTEYVDYKKQYMKDRFFIVISQSGCSTNIIEAVQDIKEDGLPFLVLTGNMDGDIKNYASEIIEYGVGNETIDYVTLGFTTLVEYLILFSLEIGFTHKNISCEEYTDALHQIEQCCEINKEMYKESVEFTNRFYRKLLDMDKAMIVADGANMGIAREAALKFQETLKIPTMYYECEEFIHGPNMQLNPDYTVFFLDTNKKRQRIYEAYKGTQLITKNAFLITDKEIGGEETVIKIRSGVDHELTPLVTVVPFQYISSYVTIEKNGFKCDPLFEKFEEKIKCKTDNYEEVMKEKIKKDKEGDSDA